jgi:hypothetical protein
MSNYKMRNQSIMEEISDNLKKTIKKWNEMENEEDNSEVEHKGSSKSKKSMVKFENEEDRSKKKEIYNTINNFDSIRKQIERKKDVDLNKNTKSSIDKIESEMNVQDKLKNNIENNFSHSHTHTQYNSSEYFKNLSHKNLIMNQMSDSQVTAQSNKISKILDDLNDEMNTDFKEMEDIIESVERELKSFIN